MGQRIRRARVAAAWVVFVGPAIGWPARALTFARDELPVVLAPSCLAHAPISADLITVSQVHQESGENSANGKPDAAQ